MVSDGNVNTQMSKWEDPTQLIYKLSQRLGHGATNYAPVIVACPHRTRSSDGRNWSDARASFECLAQELQGCDFSTGWQPQFALTSVANSNTFKTLKLISV